MPELPIKSATVVCQEHPDVQDDTCAVCKVITNLQSEAQRYKLTRDRLMRQLLSHLEGKRATIRWIA